ncbi:MAG: hypothetical protein QXT43_02395 [Candidatus Micrarchaeaceae archaeon]
MQAKATKGADFGAERMYLRERDRIHLSLSTAEKSSSELAQGSAFIGKYSEQNRYLLCKGIIFDIMLSVYDVNTQSILAFRTLKHEDLRGPLRTFVKQFKRPNLEIRAIGMQNLNKDYNSELAQMVEEAYMLAKPHAKLVEVDLFGSDQRHIAIDTKLGMTFDLLLFNRFYKPGELSNQTSFEQFRQNAQNVFKSAKQK